MWLLLLPSLVAAEPDQVVLEGVPRIGFDVNLCPFVGSTHALLKYLGAPADFDWLMGVSGAAFRRIWNRDDGGNVDLMYLAPEPYERLGRGLGYTFEVVPPGDRAALLAAIKRSLDLGTPVLAFGMVGPPECGLVFGYERGGDVLVGYSYFQEDGGRQPYRRERWFEQATFPPGGPALLLLNEAAGQRPAPREVLYEALTWAVDLARTSSRASHPDHVFGLAAYEAWAKALETDADYPRDDPEVMGTRAMVHCDQVTMLYERRSAAGFLRQMGDAVPEVAETLRTAAGLYDAVAAQCQHVWRWGHWMEPAAQLALRDPEVRRPMAEHVRAAGRQEAEAVALLETALAKLAPPPGAEVAEVRRETFTVVGLDLPVTADRPDLILYGWAALAPRLASIPHAVAPQVLYGVWHRPPGAARPRYLVGVEVVEAGELPAGLTALTIPGGRYARCAHRGGAGDFQRSYEQIMAWLKRTGAAHREGATFEVYDTRQAVDERYEVLIHEPIQ